MFDQVRLIQIIQSVFFQNGNILNNEISIQKMETFLKECNFMFEQIGFAYMQKIEQYNKTLT